MILCSICFLVFACDFKNDPKHFLLFSIHRRSLISCRHSSGKGGGGYNGGSNSGWWRQLGVVVIMVAVIVVPIVVMEAALRNGGGLWAQMDGRKQSID